MIPASLQAARSLLVELGASSRLLRHVELVGEAGEQLLLKAAELGVPLDAELVRVGIVLHDAGKIVVQRELDAPGVDHEPTGERLLLDHGASAEVARVCLSHARWASMSVKLEELVIALADKLWKGVRNPALEERVIDGMAAALTGSVGTCSSSSTARSKASRRAELLAWSEAVSNESVPQLDLARYQRINVNLEPMKPRNPAFQEMVLGRAEELLSRLLGVTEA